MAEINPPSYLAEGCYTPQQDRLLWNSLICGEGVIGGTLMTNLKVTPSDAGLSVDVAEGSAWISGDNIANQGMYFVTNDAPVTLTLATADPTDGRVDLVVATVRDAQYSGTDSDWILQVITGDPGPAPAPPSAPNNSVILAQVLVPAGAGSITTGNIADTRVPPVMCPGYESPILNMPADGSSLDSYVTNGRFYANNTVARSTPNWPNYYGQSFTGTQEGRYQGILEVFEFPLQEVLQRITEIHLGVVWERTCSGSGVGTWSPWYPVAGPGRWVKAGVYTIYADNWSGNGSTDGATDSGMRKVNGMIEMSFRVTSKVALDLNTNANASPDVTIGFIDNPSFRPSVVQNIAAAVPGYATLFVRVRPSGAITFTHGCVPNQHFDIGTDLDISATWPAPPNV